MEVPAHLFCASIIRDLHLVLDTMHLLVDAYLIMKCIYF